MNANASIPLRADASVKSAARAIDIVEHVAAAPTPPSAQVLSEALDIPASSLSYLLATLVARGWLATGERRTYVIGPALAGLAAPGVRSPADLARPAVRDLRRQLNETCGYYEARGRELLALVSELGQQSLNFAFQVGERGPLHAFAAGRALLAFGPAAEMEAYLARGGLERFTSQTLTDPSALRADLDATRERGFALADGEHTAGLVSLAVPVGGERLGAISVAIPAVRCDAAARDRVLALLRAAQGRLGAGPLAADAAAAPL